MVAMKVDETVEWKADATAAQTVDERVSTMAVCLVERMAVLMVFLTAAV